MIEVVLPGVVIPPHFGPSAGSVMSRGAGARWCAVPSESANRLCCSPFGRWAEFRFELSVSPAEIPNSYMLQNSSETAGGVDLNRLPAAAFMLADAIFVDGASG